ncbi:13447_t:CDS:2, partial [Cetraspora pellucida]
GKSTVANMLLKRDLYEKNLPITKNTTAELPYNICNDKFNIFIINGLGERQLEISEPKGRFTDNDHREFKEFKDVFNNGERNVIIIITHCKQKWVDDIW